MLFNIIYMKFDVLFLLNKKLFNFFVKLKSLFVERIV